MIDGEIDVAARQKYRPLHLLPHYGVVAEVVAHH